MELTILENAIWVEKYRPQSFDELILESKEELKSHLGSGSMVPHFIFYSNKPGTGKTTTAKVIMKELQCDGRVINSSDDRGIDTIRTEVKSFINTLSSDGKKKCVFLDEADGLTKQAQESLKNMMETYSDNCFFILSCNDISKIVEPLRSRCVSINFEKPDKAEIIMRLIDICEKEEVNYDEDSISNIVSCYYPDIRSMVQLLQRAKIRNVKADAKVEGFLEFFEALKNKNVSHVYEKAYNPDFNIDGFNIWLFKYIFENCSSNLEKYSIIANALAENERSWQLGVNREIIFIANMLEIMKVL